MWKPANQWEKLFPEQTLLYVENKANQRISTNQARIINTYLS